MNILYAFLIALTIYPLTGTLLFGIVEHLKIPLRLKIVIMSFCHPVLAALLMWVTGSVINKEVAETGVLVVAGSLLRLPFSNRKYFSTILKEQGTVTIEYFTEFLFRKKIRLPAADIIECTQSNSLHFFDAPSELKVTLANSTLEFSLLDKKKTFSL